MYNVSFLYEWWDRSAFVILFVFEGELLYKTIFRLFLKLVLRNQFLRNCLHSVWTYVSSNRSQVRKVINGLQNLRMCINRWWSLWFFMWLMFPCLLLLISTHPVISLIVFIPSSHLPPFQQHVGERTARTRRTSRLRRTSRRAQSPSASASPTSATSGSTSTPSRWAVSHMSYAHLALRSGVGKRYF